MAAFATVEDIITLWRPLSEDEQARAEALLPLVSDLIRQAATNAGKDIDAMVSDSEVYANVVRGVTVDVTVRVMRQDTEGDAMTQESQTGLGYTWSGTYAVPGGGIGGALMYNDLKRLGLLRQRFGTVELWDGLKDSQ